MTRYRNTARLVPLAGALALLVLPTGAHAAGLFEFLFGASPPPAPSYRQPAYVPNEALELSVRPRRSRVARRPVEAKRMSKLAKPIDPVANPDWYLDDPTLRKGDIVVLKGRVLVFDGGRGSRSEDDFTALAQSRLVSKADRAKVGQMAGLPPAAVEATPKPTASAEPTKEVAMRVVGDVSAASR